MLVPSIPPSASAADDIDGCAAWAPYSPNLDPIDEACGDGEKACGDAVAACGGTATGATGDGAATGATGKLGVGGAAGIAGISYSEAIPFPFANPPSCIPSRENILLLNPGIINEVH